MLRQILRALAEAGIGWALFAFGWLAIAVGVQIGWWWLVVAGIAMILAVF